MFAFVCTGIVLVLLAYALLLPPLWKQARRTALAVALVLPLALGSLYLLIGNRSALNPGSHASGTTMDQAVDALEARLRAQPGNIDGWILLGRSRKEQQRYADAHAAFAHALQLSPRDPDLMVDLAEVIALEDGTQRVQGQSLQLLTQALAIDPRNQRAMWFMGIAQYQQQHYAQAAATWQPLLESAPPDAQPALRKQINDARTLAGLPPLPEPAASAPAAASALLNVRVDIAPAMKAQLAPNDVLFVLARQPSGPPMPLAVKRMPAQGFPLDVTLSDADGPMPTMRLSQQKTVEVIARVSKSGQALPQPGDLESTPASADVGATGTIRISIDHTVDRTPN
jgi:cytochrome c-type biogenesis protein CcmH